MKPVQLFRSFTFALLLLVATNLRAQDIIEDDFLDNIELNAKTLWEESIPAFAIKESPAQYSNESAVVIGFRRSVNIDKKSRSGFLTKGERSLIFYETVRFKIQLNDRNAVNSFTEVYFRYFDKTDGFSARITKPDGLVVPVSLSASVSVESATQVPEFFKSFFDQQYSGERRYYKVAVPGLEPGDVLEYVTTTRSKLDVKKAGYIEFTPQYETCTKIYPVLFNQIIIETDDKSFFKSMSVNGAPDFKKETSADPEFFKYVFTDANRGVEKDVNFINNYQVYPMTKFQVIYANNDKTKGSLVGERGQIKRGFTKEEIAKIAWEDYEQVGDTYYSGYGSVQKLVDALWNELSKMKSYRSWSDSEFVKTAYYRCRNLVVNRDSYFSDKMAAFIFGSLLYQRNIKSELVISVSNRIGKLSDILFDQEIRYIVKVDTSFYFNYTDHSLPREKVEDLLGAEAFIIYEPAKDGSQQIKPIRLPGADVEDNNSTYVVNARLSTGLDTLVVRRKNWYNGINKNREISDAYRYITYMVDDHDSYGGRSPVSGMYGGQQAEYYRSLRAFEEEYKEAKKKYVQAQLEREFKQKVKYVEFDITSKGRVDAEPELVFVEDFELADMTRKAGKKILVNIPGLVGSQLQIKKEERNRKHDINVGYSRTLFWVINFQIPDGYTAEGLKELAAEVNNEAGSYSCKAELKENIVEIKIRKTYKQAAMSKTKWPDMLAFVDAAFNNSFKYILLKPKN
jgi:hypothetical protein